MIIPIIIIVVLGAVFVMASKLGSGVKSGVSYKLPSAQPPGQPAYLGSQNKAGFGTKTALSKSDFYSTVINYGKAYDLSILIPLTMAALETNYAKSCYFHNLFNITTQSNDPNFFFKYPTIPTLKFKMYTGFSDSVSDFWRVFNLPRYSFAYQNRHNPEQAITELIKGGYSGNDPITGLSISPDRYLSALHFVRSYYNSHYV